MAKFTVEITQTVRVELDASKFDDSFMKEFRESFYPFHEIEEHAMHIAQLTARGLIDTGIEPDVFIEGYGPANEMGINASVVDLEIDDVSNPNDQR